MLSLAIITTLTFAQPPKPPAVPPVRCALKVKKMFHDEHNQPSSPITFGVYEIKDAKDGSGYSITSLNGSGWTTTATRDAKTGFLTVTLPGVKKTYSGRADGAPKEPCEFFNWYDSKTPQGMPALEWGPGPLPPPAAPCAFKNEVWHSEPMSPEQEAEGFVFNSLNTTHFTIHSMNNTFDDTVAIIVNVQSGDDRPVSAVFSNENPRKAVSQGIMRGTVCENLAWSIISGNATNMDYWNKGPIPPPPPPPPAQCETSYNKTACDAVKPPKGNPKDACAWCTSKDGAHALCFHADHEPKAGWSCDRSRN